MGIKDTPKTSEHDDAILAVFEDSVETDNANTTSISLRVLRNFKSSVNAPQSRLGRLFTWLSKTKQAHKITELPSDNAKRKITQN